MLREAALSHFLKGSEHGVEGAEVFPLDNLLKEFLVVPGKVGMMGCDFIDMAAGCHISLNIKYMVANVGDAVFWVKAYGSSLGFGGGLFNTLFVYTPYVH